MNCPTLVELGLMGQWLVLEQEYSWINSPYAVEIGTSVTSIGDTVFYCCGGLTYVTIPNTVTSIGVNAFSGCGRLTSISVETDNPNYPTVNGMLLSKDGKTLIQGIDGSVMIPDSVTNIGDYAFAGCGSTSITIPDSVTSIGKQAFQDCASLVSVTIPNGITNIGIAMFQNCSRLASITIPDSVTSIGVVAFSGCRGLTSVTIPNSVTNIGNLAFSGCRGLTSVTFQGKTLTQVKGMSNYSWGISNTSIINVA